MLDPVSTLSAHSGERRTSRLLVNAVWLLRLRWVAVFGQLITIAVAAMVLHVELPAAALSTIVLFTAITNLSFSGWLRAQARRPLTMVSASRTQFLLVAVMTLDLFSLAGLLYFSGGPANPFIIFFFVNLALAAVLLPERWGWTLTAIAILCLLGLSVDHLPLAYLNQPSSLGLTTRDEPIRLGQIGLLVSLAACAVVVVYFITRVNRELRQRERELRLAEQQRARSERLEALGTLAAGAGHELATPLSTIAVVSKELTRHLENVAAPVSVFQDIALIRSEVDRCRTILDRMSGHLGQGKDEELLQVTVDELVDNVLQGVGGRERIQVEIPDDVKQHRLHVPLQGVAQAIRGVVQNALDASGKSQAVQINVAWRRDFLCLVVCDHGSGMTADVLARAGEPFFTTKQPGEGMGLGLFLTRTVIERLGGSLELRSSPSAGVTVEIRLPMASPHLGTKAETASRFVDCDNLPHFLL